MAKPTLNDVAAQAGVSLTTTSMVLSRKDERISAKTREKVWQAAAVLGYERDTVASALRTGVHDYILILLANQNRPVTRSLLLDSPFFADFVAGLEYAAGSRHVQFAFSRIAEAESLRDLYKTRRPRGALVLGRMAPDVVVEIGRWDVPTVVVDDRDACASLAGNPAVRDFSLDDFRMGYVGMDYLIGLGHRRIGLLFPRLGDSPVHAERHRGAVQAMIERGLSIEDARLIEVETASFLAAQARAAQIERELVGGVSAILCMADILALGCHAVLTRLGLAVPGRVSLCGMDGLCLTDYLPYRLTTVDQDIVSRGAAALDLALGLPATPVQPPRMRIGDTTAVFLP